jgi:hypothetical protein
MSSFPNSDVVRQALGHEAAISILRYAEYEFRFGNVLAR